VPRRTTAATEVVLPDGARLQIRPITRGDRARVAAGFEHLSPESRYRRFFSQAAELSEHELDYLTRVDHRDHEALIALDAVTGDTVGVARFVRVDEPTAMPAIAVVDSWQRRGVGSRLLEYLVQRALEEGYERFRADVLADNVDAIRIFTRLGEVRTETARGITTIEVELPAGGEAAPRGLRALLAIAGEGRVTPARSLWHRIAKRRADGRDGHIERAAPIVVGTNGRPAAAAILHAARLARALDSPLHIVYARRLYASRRSQADLLERAAAAVSGDRLTLEVHARRGDPAQALLDVAEEVEAGLLVVGSSGPAGTAAEHLGGVALAVARDAACDVMIVRTADWSQRREPDRTD
jgi:nucleotide-binding universal stress UspA family protein